MSFRHSYLQFVNRKYCKRTATSDHFSLPQWRACPGYGGDWASAGLPVLEVVCVFQAEFPGVSHGSSTLVALFGLTQALVAGST